MVSFVDEHRGVYGVEPICEVLPIAPSVYYEQKARQADPGRRPARARRVFGVDALRCPRCARPMVVLALISDLPVVARILTHLGLPAEPPALAPAGERAGDAADLNDLFVDLEEPPGELPRTHRGGMTTRLPRSHAPLPAAPQAPPGAGRVRPRGASARSRGSRAPAGATPRALKRGARPLSERRGPDPDQHIR
jgi:hypothetical protein